MAMHLRAMNMLVEEKKDNGARVVVPSSAAETMGIGGVIGLTALAKKGV